jgi:membrane-bound serine protease (ClpP class)
MRRVLRHIVGWVPAALAVCLGWHSTASQAQQHAPPVVYVATIDGVIDLGLAPFIERLVEEAHEAGAQAVVLRINTFGGRVDAAVQIRDAILASPVPTIAFIDKRAISAGALIALAAEKIVMAGGGTIGAATPVQMGQPGGEAQPAGEKTVSYVRKEFRATAEQRNRPVQIAEAMVDADVVVPGLVEKGKLLTLTTQEALEHGIADARAETLEAALAEAGFAGAETRSIAPNWAENVVRFLTHPIVSSMLMTVALLGILLEMRTPGFGIPGAIGVACLMLFFWGHWLVQLAGWEEVLLVFAGLVLVALEVFVIPGFGIAGLAGILALLAGLAMSLTGSGASAEFIVRALTRVVFSLLFAVGIGIALLRVLPRLPVTRRLVLETHLGATAEDVSMSGSDLRWLGKRGRASSPLRPAGIATIEEHRVDVVSEGEHIAAGEPIEVTRVDGNRVVVRRAPPPGEIAPKE